MKIAKASMLGEGISARDKALSYGSYYILIKTQSRKKATAGGGGKFGSCLIKRCPLMYFNKYEQAGTLCQGALSINDCDELLAWSSDTW